MKKLSVLVLCGIMVMVVAGCASTPEDDFEKMQRNAMKIRDNGGLAAAGIGLSKNQPMAYEKGKIRARSEVARIMEVKVMSLQKDFREEVGESEAAEYNELFSDATKNLVNTKLTGSMVKDIAYRKTETGWSANVLVVLDPKVMAEVFKKAGNDYTRFRASQAFKELDSEIEKYEEWQLRNKAIMMGQGDPNAKK